jgi:hypothetical protein
MPISEKMLTLTPADIADIHKPTGTNLKKRNKIKNAANTKANNTVSNIIYNPPIIK